MKLSEFAGKRIAVWGLGAEGRAAVQLLRQHGEVASITVMTDDNPAVDHASDGVPWLQIDSVDFSTVDIVVKSPGVSPLHPILRDHIVPRGIALTGGTALWFAHTNGDRTIGVTGSKGKSTTSSLIAHFLRALACDVVLAGNVGRAPLDVMLDQLEAAVPVPDWYVFELSSFQCAEIQNSPAIGVLTALFPEHLDWHGTVERYYNDKCNLFAHGRNLSVVANVDNPTVAIRAETLPNITPYGRSNGLHVDGSLVRDIDGFVVVDLANSALVGRHNAINVCGALTAVRLAGFDLHTHTDRLGEALRTFRPLAHRLEPVGDHRGRQVIDDSLSTAPEAAVAALAAFADRPVGIIIGGHDRGLDYNPLAEAIAARTTPTWVCCVPQSGERILQLIESALLQRRIERKVVHCQLFDDFDDAVAHAANVVPVGGVLLLSPAAPSFGRFTNYADRGHHFRSLLGVAVTAVSNG